ncbi:hypothetical protein OH77DRAFT_1417678 [Trametes cingulata]|nr:hypothetical protein OH77DRAFT_1417678 [Trametes cingulata]
MFLRRALVQGRRSALRLTARPSRTFHARAGTVPPGPHVDSLAEPSKPRLLTPTAEDAKDQQLSNAIDEFLHAVTSLPGQSLRTHYKALVNSVNAQNGFKSVVSREDGLKLQKALSHLAQSRRVQHIDILSDAVRLVARLLDTDANEYAEDVFWRLLAGGDLTAAYAWLDASAEMKGLAYASELPSWHQLLEAAAEQSDVQLLRNALRRMSRHGVQPTQETSSSVFRALFRGPSPRNRQRSRRRIELPPPFSLVKDLVRIIASHGVPYDTGTLEVITTGYKRAGHTQAAKEAEVVFTDVLGATQPLTQERFNQMLDEVAKRANREHVTRTYQRFARLGLIPSEDTFLAVMGESRQLSDLKHWEHVLGIKPTSRVVAEVMARRAKENMSIIEVFDYAMSRGVPFTSTMLHLLIKSSLASRGLQKPTDNAIDAALAFYHRFVGRPGGAEESNSGNGVPKRDAAKSQKLLDGESTNSPSRKTGLRPDVATYQLLLRALTASTNTAKYLPSALSLLEDMRNLEIGLDPQTAASIIILLMSLSETPAEAFRMYTVFARPVETAKPVLNEEGYVAVLSAFCKLPTWPDGIPSVRLYGEILADMRKYGVPLGPKAYTVLLGQLAKLATTASATGDVEGREKIVQTITRVHNHINLNASFTPDTALWNQLMDAYQRAGCFLKASRIWQTLFLSTKFNATSVSIILDACAWAQAYDMAVRVYGALTEVGFPMNMKNWNTYLECLCRLDRLDEAMKVLCLEMTNRDDGIEPDKESVRILLKFAVKRNREGEVRSRIKRFLPKLYYSLQEEE